jgi:YfiH family protein
VATVIEAIEPDWSAPPTVRALTTTRRGGISTGAWASLNLAAHVGDDPMAVAENRARLRTELALPVEPAWLQQVHGIAVVSPEREGSCADACVSGEIGSVCAVMTADCLPVVFCNRRGTRVAVAHAGWRGLLAGVLESTLIAFDDPADEVLAWLGPAIGPETFEVGEEVRAAFVKAQPTAEVHFRAARPGHWLADLYGLARQRLAGAGVVAVSGGDYCTLSDAHRFFSYRRDGVTGRMATLVWLQPS